MVSAVDRAQGDPGERWEPGGFLGRGRGGRGDRKYKGQLRGQDAQQGWYGW